jgi:hypothetical protein
MNDIPAPSRPSFLKRLRRFVLLAALAAVVLFGLYTWAAWSFTYSEGDRAGYVQKFSKKGWICKTWEGELAMANIPGSMPQIFQFTVWDDQVAADMNASMGERVTVHYKQHVGLPSTCFGETQYFVQRVRRVEN